MQPNPIMAERKPMLDEFGIIYEALKLLPDDKLKIAFLESLLGRPV